VIEHKADVGIALDGDADRVIMVDENAQIIDGDTILAICAKDLKRKGLLKNNVIVSTIACNLGFLKSMEEEGIRVIQAAVGDRYVIQEMLKHDASLGGEQSGHLISLDHNTTGDGIVAALQVLKIMIETDSKLSDLAATVKKFPQVIQNVSVSKKPPIDTLKDTRKLIQELQKELGSSGSVMVRYSGTELLLRVTVQGPKLKQIQQIASKIAASAQEEIG
jgi:phosphoglucosamine mutase